jgi:hypothetical protein
VYFLDRSKDRFQDGIGHWRKKLIGITKPEIKEEASFMAATYSKANKNLNEEESDDGNGRKRTANVIHPLFAIGAYNR